jgi:AcrR family transcriptional regulator
MVKRRVCQYVAYWEEAGSVERKRLSRGESRRLTRERLLDAAADAFAVRGYHGASLEEIAEAAGFSRGAVYSNFTGKEDLFLALLDRRLEGQAEAWWAMLGADEPDHTFERELERNRGWHLAEAEFLLHVARDERVREALAERYRRTRDDLAAFLERRYAERGEAPPLPIGQLARLVSALGTGLAVEIYANPGSAADGTYAAAVAHLLRGGSEVPSRREPG